MGSHRGRSSEEEVIGMRIAKWLVPISVLVVCGWAVARATGYPASGPIVGVVVLASVLASLAWVATRVVKQGMNRARWTGLGMVVVGAGICAWQVYETRAGTSLTFWIIGFIPLPVIVLGILLVLGGLVAFIRGKE
jgi:hypothetical protein